MTRAFSRLSLFVMAVSLMALLSVPAQAQDQTRADAPADQDQPTDSDAAQPLDATPAMTMERVEAAYQAEDFVTARAGLATLAATSDSGNVHYRYGRILTDPRGGEVDLPLALTHLERAVALDHVPAATLMARLYLSDLGQYGVPRDAQRAAQLLQGNATRGDADSQYYYALLLRAGDGVTQNDADAFLWMRAAAEQGHVASAHALSEYFAQGIGTEQNGEKAVHWMRRAASDGHADAQLALANAYETGEGVPQNRNTALDWYRRAAESGQPLAMRIVGVKYLQGDGLYEDGPSAVAWLSKAAAAGEPGALFNMAVLHATGNHVPQDDSLTVTYLEAAHATGLLRATHMLAAYVEKGRGTDADLPRAVALYTGAARAGHAPSTAALAQLATTGALDGLLAPHDMAPWVERAALDGDAPARQWLQAQADAGLRTAQTRLAKVMIATDDNPKAAADLLERAALAGDTEAQFLMGEAHSTGLGRETDYVTAHSWFNVAATQGHQQAAQSRQMLTALMTPEQVDQAQAKARAFLANPPTPPALQTGEPGDKP